MTRMMSIDEALSTIIPCRLHKDGGLYVRSHQVHRYHGEVHDPRYDS